MRILVAPDCFTGSLTAAEAASSITTGWSQTWPGDDFITIPMSDGGPGFIDSVCIALGATRVPCIVLDPLGREVPAEFALLGERAWIESAQACGLAHLALTDRNPAKTSTYGVGQLIDVAIKSGAREITIGLGGSGTNDAGAGAIAALGAVADAPLDKGGYPLREVSKIDLSGAISRLEGTRLTIASDVDNPLLGLRGASAIFGPQKGASEELVMQLEGSLEHFAKVCGRREDGKDPAVALGAGAAGGLGYGLMLLGAVRISGIEAIMDMLNINDAINDVDLVITGEGCLDDQSLHGKVIAGIAARAVKQGKPVVAVAGQVRLGKREASAAGIDSAYSMSELVGKEESMAKPQETLTALAARIATTWGRR
jgi:glycerate kinase